MTNQQTPFDSERIDDEIEQRWRIADADPLTIPPAGSSAAAPDARLLADLRRVYRFDAEDARSLDRVYARLRAHERDRSMGASAADVGSVSPSQHTARGWPWMNSATDTLPPASAENRRRSRRPYLMTGVGVLLVVGLLIGSFSLFAALRARHTTPQTKPTPTQQPVHDGKLLCSASFGKSFDLLMSGHPDLDWSATGRLAIAHPYLKIASAQTCAAEPVNWQVNPTRPVWSPDGRRLLLLTTNMLTGDTGHVLDAATGHELAAIHTQPRQSFEQAAWTADGSQLVAIVHTDYLSHSTESLAIQVWRASDGALVKDALPVREVLIGSVSLAPNGASFTMQRADHRIEFWSMASGQQISITASSIAKGDAYTPAIDGAWSRDGASFAIALPNPTWPAGPTEIQVWSTATGKVAQSLSESDSFQGMIEALAWSPDGRYLAESSGAIHIWDVAEQKEVATFGAIATTTTASDGKITTMSGIAALAWAPDNRGLASLTGSAQTDRSARPDQETDTLNVWRLS